MVALLLLWFLLFFFFLLYNSHYTYWFVLCSISFDFIPLTVKLLHCIFSPFIWYVGSVWSLFCRPTLDCPILFCWRTHYCANFRFILVISKLDKVLVVFLCSSYVYWMKQIEWRKLNSQFTQPIFPSIRTHQQLQYQN